MNGPSEMWDNTQQCTCNGKTEIEERKEQKNI